MVNAHNERTTAFKLEINKFADLTQEERSKYLGLQIPPEEREQSHHEHKH